MNKKQVLTVTPTCPTKQRWMLSIALATTLFGTTEQLHSADNVSLLEVYATGVAGLAIPAITGYIHGKINPPHNSITFNSLTNFSGMVGNGLLADSLAKSLFCCIPKSFNDHEKFATKIVLGFSIVIIVQKITNNIYRAAALAGFDANHPAQPIQQEEPIAG